MKGGSVTDIKNILYTLDLSKKEIERICIALENDIQNYVYELEDPFIIKIYQNEEEFAQNILSNDCYEQFELLCNFCDLIQWSGAKHNIKVAVKVRYEKALSVCSKVKED